MNRRLVLAGLFGALVTPLTAASVAGIVPLASLLGGCVEGRYPVCHTDGDCRERDAGKASTLCINLRCVECHYDADCAAGSICTSTGTCDALDHRPTAAEGDGGAPETKSWDPTNWNECAAACKDQDCVGACDRRFHAK
ncbi:MAG: hypothetical protein ABJE95_10170 [Byssovorax sp.]